VLSIQAVRLRPVRIEYDEEKGARGRIAPAPVGTTSQKTGAAGLRRGQVGLRDGRGCPAVTISVARMPEPIRGARRGGSAQTGPVCRGVAGPAASLDPRWHAGHAGDRDGRRSRCRTSQGGGHQQQTISNEFGSRQASPRGTRCDWQTAGRRRRRGHRGNVGNIYQAFLEGSAPSSWSRVRSARHLAADGGAKPDLLQIITTDSAPIISRCSQRLTTTLTSSWCVQRRGRRSAGEAIVRWP